MRYGYVLLVVAILFEAKVFAEEIFVYTTQEPPLNFTETKHKDWAKGNDVTGFTTDVVREVLNRIGLSAEIQLLPWARGYMYALEKKNVFLYSMSRTGIRENLFKWVGPIAKKKQILFAKKGFGIKINSLEDAKQVEQIGTMRDDSKEQYLKKKGFTNILSLNQWAQGLKMLMLGRVTLWTSTNLDAPVIARNAGLSVDDLENAYVLFESSLYIGVSKSTSDDLVQKWQSALNMMKRDGTFEKLIKKWAKYYNTASWIYKDGVLQTE